MKKYPVYFTVILLVLAMLTCCHQLPEAPTEGNNPFDARNPETEGDPFRLKAAIGNGGITLNWNIPDITTLNRFNIYRKMDGASFELLATPSGTKDRYTDTAVQNGHVYSYYITATDKENTESSRTNTARVTVRTEPVLVINGDSVYTMKRQVRLTILAHGASQMMLSNDNAFNGAQWESYATFRTWELLPGAGEKKVYMKVRYDSTESPAIKAHILPQPMEATFSDNKTKYTTNRQTELTLSAKGENLRMKISEDSSFTGMEWMVYRSGIDYTLPTGKEKSTIYAKVKNDFEIISPLLKTTVILDTIPPLARLSVLPDSGITGETIFQLDPGGSSDNTAPIPDMRVRYDFDNDGNYDTGWESPETITHVFTTGGGDRQVRIQLRDGAGLITETGGSVFVNTRPRALFTASKDIINYRLYHFDASGSSDYEDGSNLLYRWDFNGDGIWDTNWQAQSSIDQEYSDDGFYTVKLNVRDQHQLGSEKVNSIYISMIEMIYVAGGAFTMGDTWGDGDSDELPAHTVTVDNFYMGKYEITNSQVADVFNWALAKGKIIASSSTVQNAEGNQQELLYLNGSYCQISYNGSQLYVESGLDSYPVIDITWYGAAAFCNYLSEKEGLTPVYDFKNWIPDWSANGYRMPTEAEWEYAARGGNQSKGYKYSGSDNVDEVAWYSDNSGGHTHEVGTKNPNELGIYDMSGNVWEWCWDLYSNTYYSSSPQDNPKGAYSWPYRVLRGGSWHNYSGNVRVANRNYKNPRYTNYHYGFRILRPQ